MATVVTWKGDGLSAGAFTVASVGTGDSPAPAGLLGAGHAVMTASWRGPLLQLTQPVGNSSAVFWNFTSASQIAFRFYYIARSPIATNHVIMRLMAGGATSQVMTLNVTSTGRFQTYNAANTLGTQSATGLIAQDTRYRFEGVLNTTTGSLTVYLYDAESTVEIASITQTPAAGAYGTGADRIYLGNHLTTPTAEVIQFDDLVVTNTATLIGAAVPTAPTFVDRVWSGNGLAAGNLTISSAGTGDTAPDAINGGTSMTIAAEGSRSPAIKSTQVAGSSSNALWNHAGTTLSSGRVYFTPLSTIAANHTIIRVADGTTRVADINITSTGSVNVYDSTNALVGSSTSGIVTLNNTFRFTWTFDTVAGTGQVMVYANETTTPLTTVNVTGNFGTTISRIYLGNPAATPTSEVQRFDDLYVNNTATPPGAVAPSTGSWAGLGWKGDGLSAGPLTTSSAGTGDTAPSIVTSTPTIITTAIRTPAIQMIQPAGTAIFARWNFTPQTYLKGRVYFTPSGTLGANHTIIRVSEGATRTMDINLTGLGAIRVYDATNALLTSSPDGSVVSGTRYRIDWAVDIIAGTLTVRLYNGDQTTPISTLGPLPAALTGTISSIYLGTILTSVVAETQVWDDLILGDSALNVGPVATAPVAVVGANLIDVEPYTTVALTGSDSTGAASYLWTQVSGQAVTITNATSANASFIAPANSAGTTLTFRLTVTASSGTTNSKDMTVAVEPHLEWLRTSGSLIPIRRGIV